ncbi:protein NO VEIN domain-containing protein [Tundrisphaera sp. TA3]|uniref:protein NO VEIN domain-containing protein n=1 Tax=Tundrisphaera sp. TA3 TaxID=3435775 RepID=UPI003EC0F5A5
MIGDRPLDAIFEDRPDRIIVPASDEKPWLSRKGKSIDFARRDAMNRHLGQLGEKFAIDVERRRLLFCGRDDLAAKVEWVAMTCGDGFDVLSFDEGDESERFIEVKTTGLGKHFPF